MEYNDITRLRQWEANKMSAESWRRLAIVWQELAIECLNEKTALIESMVAR